MHELLLWLVLTTCTSWSLQSSKCWVARYVSTKPRSIICSVASVCMVLPSLISRPSLSFSSLSSVPGYEACFRPVHLIWLITEYQFTILHQVSTDSSSDSNDDDLLVHSLSRLYNPGGQFDIYTTTNPLGLPMPQMKHFSLTGLCEQ